MGNYLVVAFLGDMKGIRKSVGGVFKSTLDTTFLNNSIEKQGINNCKLIRTL